MVGLRYVVSLVEEAEGIESSLPCTPHGGLEDPPATDDLTSLMHSLMGPPSSVPDNNAFAAHPTSPVTKNTPPTLLYGRTIGIAAGKSRLWAG